MELYLSTNYVLKISAQTWSFKSVQKVLIFQFFFSVSAFGTEFQCQSFLQCDLLNTTTLAPQES